MYDEKRRMEIITSVLSEKIGIGISVVEDGPTTAWYDGKNLYLARLKLKAQLAKMHDKDIKYLIYHEAAHALYSNLKPLDNLREIIEPPPTKLEMDDYGRERPVKNNDPGPLKGLKLSKDGAKSILSLTQALEDIRIENNISKKYEGVREEIKNKRREIIKDDPEHYQKLFEHISPASIGVGEILKQRIPEKYKEIVPEEIRKILDNKDVEALTKKVSEAKDSWEVMDLAQQVHSLVKKYYNKQEYGGGCTSHSHGTTEGEKGDKKGEGKGKPDKGDGKGDGDGEGEGKDGEDGDGKKFVEAMAKKWNVKKDKEHEGTTTLLPDLPPVLSVDFDIDGMYEILAEAKAGDQTGVVKEKDLERYERKKSEIGREIKSLQRQIKDLFILKTKSRYEPGYTSGKLISTKDIWKMSQNNDKIFMKRYKEHATDYAITVLIDQSGSMSSESKIGEALKSAIVLSEVLSSLGIPFEVLGFSTHSGVGLSGAIAREVGSGKKECRTDYLKHFIYKQFDERYDKEVQARMGYITSWGNNFDGEAILWAYKRLSEHKAREKVLIVLSDGQPAGSETHSKNCTFTKMMIKAAEKRIKVIGIGYLTNTVKEFYKNYILVKNTSELPSTFCKILNKVLNKGSIMY